MKMTLKITILKLYLLARSTVKIKNKKWNARDKRTLL